MNGMNDFASPAARERVQAAIAELRGWLDDRLSTALAVREQHGRGEAPDAGAPADAVAWPLSADEVSRILAGCTRHRVPVIAYGTGTSLEGHVSAPFGGICVDVSRMDQVLEVHAEDADVVVQPGVTREQLNAHLRDSGLFFPVDPGANASLGGMVSTRACVVADVCVPISALADTVAATRADIDAEGLTAPILGHVGDGNFHVLFLQQPGSADDAQRVARVYDAMVARGHAAAGTCTGEHGIGLGKRDKLLAEVGADVVALMRGVKQAWDPLGILNPGKVFSAR